MCEYCDCRRVREIAELGEEHERIQDLADEAMMIARAGGPGLVEALVRLRDALDPHVSREEAGIFEVAREAGLAAYYVDDLEEDHRRFAAALESPEGIDLESLEMLLDDLHRHIAIEEYDLFPAAARVLDPDARLVASG